MNKEQLMVREFHEKFGLTINEKPTKIKDTDITLRNNLIWEETNEFIEADSLVDKLDALADLLYVVYGAGVSYGFDLEKAFEEVHRSNMTKLWSKAEVETLTGVTTHNVIFVDLDMYLVKRKSDGKIIKSPSYSPADLKQFIGETT